MKKSNATSILVLLFVVAMACQGCLLDKLGG